MRLRECRLIKILSSLFCGSHASSTCSSVTSEEENKMISSVDLIEKYEGFRSQAYKCPAGVYTIGFGSTTYADGKPVKKGDEISKETAEGLLINYLDKNVRPYLSELGLTKDTQIAAVESLIYNIGWPAFSKSKCCKAIKEKDWETVFKNWDWCKASGKFLVGLAKRRAEELSLFFKDL